MPPRKRRRFEDDEGHEVEDQEQDGSTDNEQEQQDEFNCSQQPGFDFPKNEAEVGIIEKITLVNFMCHTMLEVPLGPNVNFIIGRNGSGKSAILTALVVGLGGKAITTSRGSSLKGFINEKCSSAQVVIKLRNKGHDAYKSQLYGPSIIVERRINSDGSSSYKIKSHEGKVISQKKDELNHILDQFNIQVDNPVSVLNQDTSRNFLNSSDPKDKYKFFLKATQLEQMSFDYQQIIEHKEVIKNTLSRKSETLPEMQSHVKKLEDQYKDIAQLKNMKEQVEELKKLRVWAEVMEHERKVLPMEKAVQEQKDKLPRYDEKIGVFQAEITALENEWRAAGQQENEIKEEAQSLQSQQQEIFAELKQKKSVLRDKQSKIRKLGQDKRSANCDKEQLEERIQEIKSTAMRDLESERRCREETLRQKREELHASESQLSTTSHHRGQIEQALNRTRERIYQLKSERQDARRHLDQAQRDLQNLQGSRSNRFSLFGAWVPDLIQRVETAVKRGRFHQPPVGPIGAYIRLKDDKWALAVESCLKGLGWSFCCHDSHDQQLLQQMMKQAGVRNVPNIIVSKFQEHVYDVSRNRPNCDYPSILDILVIDKPVVANCLIDQANVEMVLLIEDPKTAREVIFTRPPSNMRKPRAFTPTGEHLIGGSMAKSYATYQKAAAYLQKDIEGEIRRLQADVNERTVQQQQLEQELRDAELSQQQNTRELDRAKKKALKEQQEVNRIMGEINEIENAEDEQLPDVTTLEEEVKSYSQRLQEIEEQSQVVQEEFEQAKDAVVKQELRSNQHKEKIQQLLEKADPFRNEMQKIERDIAEKKAHRKHYEDRRKIIEENIRTAQKDLDKMTRKVEHTTHLASQYCERVDPGRRTVKSLESEIEQMDKRIAAEERERGNHEKITRAYFEAKKKYEDINKSMKSLKKYHKRLEDVMSQRAISFINYRKYIAVRAKYFFQMMLAQRGYSGRMKFDHANETLGILVNVEPSTKSVTKDTRSLSGGERSFSTVSFIMALWEAMESPFRCLDEFDIFMDMVNRRMSMDMMMKVAKEQVERQFIILTPLNMSGIEGGRNLKIFRLQDPERGQTILPFGQQ